MIKKLKKKLTISTTLGAANAEILRQLRCDYVPHLQQLCIRVETAALDTDSANNPFYALLWVLAEVKHLSLSLYVPAADRPSSAPTHAARPCLSLAARCIPNRRASQPHRAPVRACVIFS